MDSGIDGPDVTGIVEDGAVDDVGTDSTLGTVRTVDGTAASSSPAPHPIESTIEAATRTADASRARGDTGRD